MEQPGLVDMEDNLVLGVPNSRNIILCNLLALYGRNIG